MTAVSENGRPLEAHHKLMPIDDPAPSLRVILTTQPADQGEDSHASIDECSPPVIFEAVAHRDANTKAVRRVKATDSEPVKGKELLESDELKRQLSEAEERLRSGLSPKKPKSLSR